MLVLTLGGMNYGTVDRCATALRGYAANRLNIDFPQSFSASSMRKGLSELDVVANDLDEPFEVLGMSQGAEIIGDWLDQGLHPGLRKVTLIGNPERKYGGAYADGFPWSYNFCGKRKPTRTDLDVPIDDITRLGDPWSNADQWGVKDRKSSFGMLLAKLGIGSTHTDYDDVDVSQCQVRHVEGRTRYLVAP